GRVDTSVFPVPANPRANCHSPVDGRSGVYVRDEADGMIDALGEEGGYGLKLFAEDRMVVPAPGIAGDDAPQDALAGRVVIVVGQVRHGDGDDALGVGEPTPRPGPPLDVGVGKGRIRSLRAHGLKKLGLSAKGRRLADRQVM